MPAEVTTKPATAQEVTVGPLILLGAPGAGKGTQAKLLSSHFNVPQISTGDLLRENVSRGTELGKKADPIMKAGALVPDELMLAMVADRLRQPDTERGFILDGFPRTVHQAEWLDQHLAATGRAPVVMDIKVGYNQLLRRLTGRRSCPTDGKIYNIYFQPPKKEGVCDSCGAPLVQRKDDREEVIAKRLQEYKAQTLPLVNHYRRLGRLHEVNGELPLEQVTAGTLAAIEQATAAGKR